MATPQDGGTKAREIWTRLVDGERENLVSGYEQFDDFINLAIRAGDIADADLRGLVYDAIRRASSKTSERNQRTFYLAQIATMASAREWAMAADWMGQLHDWEQRVKASKDDTQEMPAVRAASKGK